MIWAPICATMCMVSAVATFLATFKLCRDSPARPSSVYRLLTMLFVFFFVLTTTRAAYYVWLATIVPRAPGGTPRQNELDRMGIHALAQLQDEQTWTVRLVVVVGDSALFGAFLALFQLTNQVSGLISQGMDRGEDRERIKSRCITVVNFLAIAAIFAAELSLSLRFGTYARSTHILLLGVYMLHIMGVVYMVVVVVWAKVKGRNLDAVDGERVVAPIYRRLEGILLTYAALVLQFHITSLVLFFGRKQTFASMTWMGVSTAINATTGLALSIVVGCSQPCVLRACRCLLLPPTGLELLEDMPSDYWRVDMQPGSSERLRRGNLTFTVFMMPPRPLDEVERLVFVYTDIESSSALWGVHDGRVMQEATEIHDSLVRFVLAKVGGYEIATAGDAFHLVFSTIQRAVLFCLVVQLRLMMAKWPKGLDRMAPATRTVRYGMRAIFRGLRVRMGVHCFDEADGPMVRSIHAVTGTATYTGASAVIASTVSDLAAGGQILVTAPIASWLHDHRDDVPVACVLDSTPVGGMCLSHSACVCRGAQWELFQLYPKRLAKRQVAVATATVNACQGDASGHKCCENSDDNSLHARRSDERQRRCTTRLDSFSESNSVDPIPQRMPSA